MKEDTTALLGLRALLGEQLTAPVEEAKVRVDDKTVITFTDAEEWKEAAEERGLNITNRGGDEDEFFAEEEDITMIGYFKDDWGMLV